MTAVAAPLPPARLWAYGLYGAVLAGAGLPIYIYAPKFYADSYGVSLTLLATVLFGLRLFDVVQDPVLGWLSERLGAARNKAVAVGAGLLALSMVALFAVALPLAPALWFALSMVGLFSAFSFLSITFYAQGVAKAETLPGGHYALAGWREGGALLGVSVAAVAPAALEGVVAQPFTIFALGFAAVAVLAALAMAPEWQPRQAPPTNAAQILRDPLSRRLLTIALVNAAPLAVTSTLFLFFVESRLAAPGWEGPLLVLFFLAAAASAPGWARVAERWGAKPVLLAAMSTNIVAFAFVLALGAGDVLPFAVICLITGATVGADLTLLPALFARRMAQIAPSAGQGFGLWSFTSKLTLAFAAILVLPLLERSGFVVGGESPASALVTLSLLYALVPMALKLVAISLLAATNLRGD